MLLQSYINSKQMSMFIMLGCFIFQSSMSKSRSFRDASLKSRPVKYKRNKTTNLDKLTSSMSAHTLKCPTEEEHQAMISGADHSKIKSSSYSLLSSKKKILVMIQWKGNFCSLPTLILQDTKIPNYYWCIFFRILIAQSFNPPCSWRRSEQKFLFHCKVPCIYID